MDFSNTRLVNDPNVRAAFDFLLALDVSPERHHGIIRSAEMLCNFCDNKDPDMIAAALMVEAESLVGDIRTIESVLTPRAFRMLAEATDAITGLPSSPPGGMPRIVEFKGFPSAESKLINMAIMSSLNDDISSQLGPLIELSEAIAEMDPTVDPTTIGDAERLKNDIRVHVLSLRDVFEPLLGSTGEAKLESRFITSYNKIARIVDELPMSKVPQAPKPVTPPPSRRPPQPKDGDYEL